MAWYETPYLFMLYLFSGAFCIVGWQAWQRRQAPGSRPLSYFMVSLVIWTFFISLEYSTRDLSTKIVFSKFQYLGGASTAVFLFWFGLEFYRQQKVQLKAWYAAFGIIPLITLVLVFTNESHHLIWTNIAFAPGTHQAVFDHGVWFWIYVGHTYLLVMATSILIIRAYFKMRYIFRNQALALILALPFPWLGNIIYVFHLANPGQDFTPIGLGITGMVFGWSMYRLQLFDLVPVARDHVIEWMDDGLIVFNHQRKLVDINPAGEKLLNHLDLANTGNRHWVGQTSEELIKHLPQLSTLFDPQNEGKLEVLINVDGQMTDFDVRVSTLGRKDEFATGWMLVLRDITVLKKARDQAVATANENARLYDQLKHMAVTDSLTGLSIRRHFFDLSTLLLEQAVSSQKPVSALMLDLDHFKRINDTFGHASGDRVLQTVAKICQNSLRREDIIGRYGGEEFVALLPDTDLREAEHVARRLCAAIAAARMETPNGPISITVSMGVSAVQNPDDTLAALLDRADQAMYLAKQAGRNQVKVFND